MGCQSIDTTIVKAAQGHSIHADACALKRVSALYCQPAPVVGRTHGEAGDGGIIGLISLINGSSQETSADAGKNFAATRLGACFFSPSAGHGWNAAHNRGRMAEICGGCLRHPCTGANNHHAMVGHVGVEPELLG
jgi:hypothetical protein